MQTLGAVIDRIAGEIARWQAHPSKVVVLVPFGQLLPLLGSQWALQRPDGFAPRFETTRSWARGCAADLSTAALAGDDFRQDAGLDSVTARSLLERAGWGALQDELMPRLMQACTVLAPLAAAVDPLARTAWAAEKSSGLAVLQAGQGGADALRYEAVVTHVALAWVASSAYATDVLFDDNCLAALEGLIVLDGLQFDPLATALSVRLAGQSVHLSLTAPLVQAGPANPTSAGRFAVQDFEEEALWAAACVLRQAQAREQWGNRSVPLSQPLPPVALVANDRLLIRRVRAMLDIQGLNLRDETGWTLSTTRAAATVLTALQACSWSASSDAVLDWLKNSPAFPESQVGQLETLLRQARCGLWRDRELSPVNPNVKVTPERPHGDTDAALALKTFDTQLQALLTALQAPRPLQRWLADLVAHLQASGVWGHLQDDLAGQAVVKALHLSDSAQTRIAEWPLSRRRMRLDEFSSWVRHALEASSFVPPAVNEPQVVILPLSQMLARPFFAVVIPGCDEVRLSATPELPGTWTPAERGALGLPSREEAAASLRTAWQLALQCDRVDLLWRTADSGGETLLPSPLLQLWVQSWAQKRALPGDVAATSPSPTDTREVLSRSTPAPQPRGQALPVTRLSASAYEDLRRCPYRFFALRQLGLKEMSELDDELEKRDIGDWLHEVLKDFHQALPGLATDTLPTRRELLDRCAQAASERRKFSPGEFLPYQAAWPRLRDPYLDWLTTHEATGARFECAETWHETGLGSVTLVGRVDRIDSTPALVASDASNPHADGLHAKPVLLLDYKTESPSTTKARLKTPLEDTQLAFYAALLPHDSLRAAYLNINEREGTADFEQEDVVQTRDALIEGILDDMQRIAGGAVLAALGEGTACDYCAARGLCRKDFWEAA